MAYLILLFFFNLLQFICIQKSNIHNFTRKKRSHDLLSLPEHNILGYDIIKPLTCYKQFKDLHNLMFKLLVARSRINHKISHFWNFSEYKLFRYLFLLKIIKSNTLKYEVYCNCPQIFCIIDFWTCIPLCMWYRVL